MKKCPICQRTFDDDKRFCQSDGTPLVEADGASSNPYATVVANKDEIASAIPPDESSRAISPPKDDDFLEIPDSGDSMKTTVVSDAEMKELAIERDSSGKSSSPFGNESFAQKSPSKEDDFPSPIPTPPKFNEPDLDPPTFGDSPFSPPDSPKSAAGEEDFLLPKTGGSSSSPIPSPFGEKMPPSYQTPSSSPFKEPEPPKNEPLSPFNEPSSPFGQTPFGAAEPKNQPVKQAEWTPPPSPKSSFGEPGIGANPPAASASPSAAGQSKTLAIISLVLGALGFICCGNILCGIPAIIVGFIARKKESENPQSYAGSTLAMIGMVLGALSVVTFIFLIILQIFFGGLNRLVGG